MNTQREKQTVAGLIDGIPVLYKVLAPIVLMFFWFQNNVPTMTMVVENRAQIEAIKTNFASISQYKEQQKQIDELRADFSRAIKDLSIQMEKSNQDVKQYSDKNREFVQQGMQDLKEWFKSTLSDVHVRRK